MKYLALIRHGESVWNSRGLFTGWTNVDLTDTGRLEALKAGEMLRSSGFCFDVAYTSLLRRASETLQLICRAMDQQGVLVRSTYRLNERHYGALEGLNKAESIKIFGEDQVRLWRRGYLASPPPLEEGDPRYLSIKDDPRYQTLEILPRTESLRAAMLRFLPYWDQTIMPSLRSTGEVLISAHGNIIRGIIRNIEHMVDADFEALEVPTATPVIYEFDDALTFRRSYRLSPVLTRAETTPVAA